MHSAARSAARSVASTGTWMAVLLAVPWADLMDSSLVARLAAY